METEWDTGYFIGINSRTTEYLIAKGSGIFSTTTIRRYQDDKACDPEIVKEETILHRDYVMHGAKSTPTEVRPHTAAASTPNPAAAAPMMPRRIRLRQEDFIEYGYTVGCPGCQPIQLEPNVRRGHNEECRARMEEELSKTDRGKEIMGRTKDRIDEKVAQMGEQVMQGQGEIASEVTEFVDGPEESREDASHPADDGRQAETPGEEEARANFGPDSREQHKEAKRRRDLDDSGGDIKDNWRKPSRSSKAEKRRMEEDRQAWRKRRGHPEYPLLQGARTTMRTSRRTRNLGDSR